MNNRYWQSVPIECIEEWKSIFRNNTEGAHLSENCPVCQNKELHRYYQVGRRMEAITGSNQYIARGAEWQWCSFCKSYEHQQVLVPAWWVPCLEIDGNKLTAIPEILDMAYQDEKRVNKWNRVPEQYVKLWNAIFSQNQEVVILKDKCPICSQKKLLQYYTLDIPKPVKYKKKWYQGQGAHWEWCAACFHYQFDNLAYIPSDWDYKLDVESWEFMTIPEPLNEKMRLNGIFESSNKC